MRFSSVVMALRLFIPLLNHNVFNCIVAFVLISSFLLNSCAALYEDQVGKFDWRQQYIGAVKFAHFDQSPGSRRVVIASEQNVIAAVSPRSSDLLWRQVLEAGTAGIIHALAVSEEIVTVSGLEAIVRGWDPASGHLHWESSLMDSKVEGSVINFYLVNVKAKSIIAIEGLHRSFIKIKWYSFSGELVTSTRIPVPWFNERTRCKFISTSYFVCVDVESSTIYTLLLEVGKVFHLTVMQNVGISNVDDTLNIVDSMDPNANGQHLFALQLGYKSTFILKAKVSNVELVKQFNDILTLSVTEIEGSALVFLVTKSNNDQVLKVYNIATEHYIDELQGVLDLPNHYREPEKLFVYVLPKKEGGYSYRLLISTQAQSLLLLQQPGKIVWAREESLASILSVEMVDLPVSESEAQMEKQFGTANANIMVLFFKRMMTQLIQLQNYAACLLLHLQVGNPAEGVSPTTEERLIRDEFNIHKMIVVVTSVSKVFGIDSLSGKIIWQQSVPDLRPFKRYGKPQLPLFVQRTTAHFPHSPQCTILGRSKHSAGSILYTFNPITGQPVDGSTGVLRLNYDVIQVMQLSSVNSEFYRGILLVDSNYKVHAYPESTYQIALERAPTLYFFIADGNTSEMSGYSLSFSTSKELIAGKVWSLSFPPAAQTISNVVLKRSIEHVHSQGRVMGDRSVLYKYLNPNLAVVTTEGFHTVHKSSLNVYLVDVISGQVVYSANHKRAKGPIHIVHSENWVVYTYVNEKARRVEVAVLELYEGITQSNTTAFSSFGAPISPMVEKQGYIFPSPIDSITVTITEKGITSKHLLFAIPIRGIVELPKMFLDPRRSLFPTQEHREEGIIPYSPELMLPPENLINYNQTLHRIRDIYTSPTGLESTCIVLGYGLDIYYTRITPSRTFDVLKDDFDHWLIVAVLFGLVVASYGTKRFAAWKALKQAWK